MAWAKTVAVGTSAQTVTITGENSWIEVVNIDGGGELYFTLDGATAVADADDNIVVPAAAGASVLEPIQNSRPETPTEVSIIATAACKAQVRGRSL